MGVSFDKHSHRYVLDDDYAIHRTSTRTAAPAHTHGYAEMVYTFGGNALHCIDGTPYRLGRGDLLFINYGCVHAVEPQAHSDYADIMLKPAFLDSTLKGCEDAFALFRLKEYQAFSDTVQRERHLIHFSGEERERIEALLKIALTEYTDRTKDMAYIQRPALQMLLQFIFRKMSEDATKQHCIDENLLLFIREHCHEKLRAADLAEYCFYTPAHFSRAFKKYTGKTFSCYLTESRLQRAAALLRETEKSVEEILSLCGFSGRTRFFAQFSATFGTTPLQYRKNQK